MLKIKKILKVEKYLKKYFFACREDLIIQIAKKYLKYFIWIKLILKL